MNNLDTLTNASDRVTVTENNFEKLDESMAFTRTPSRINGVLNNIVGPPTAGTWPLYQGFVDSLTAVWLCTAAGTPGVWVQIEPATLTAYPVAPPDGYMVVRSDLDDKLYRYVAASNTWTDMYGAGGGGGGGSGSANQNVVFVSEAPLLTPSYLGGRFRWGVDVTLNSASIICEAPATDMSFQLEINGVLVAHTITVPAGQTSAELDLSGVNISAGEYMRWKCTASPAAPDQTGSQIHLSVDLTPSADAPDQNVVFVSEAPLIAGYYIGARYRWTTAATLQSASIVCEAPVGADISFTLEVNGVLTAKVLTVAAGQTSAELDLTGTNVPSSQYMRWKCTASPAVGNTASQIHLSTNLSL